MIDVRNLSKSFGDLQVLRGISTFINRGEVVCIIGPSGSGKSTFLRCINRLEAKTSGEIFINGRNIYDRDIDVFKLRQSMGMVFQHFNLFPHLTVIENIVIAQRKVLGLTEKEATSVAEILLDRVGLQEKRDEYPIRLSGGQKQRIAIARSLAMKPEILLFDEPTSALDPEMVKEVLNVIRDLVRDNITMLIVTHEMGFAREVGSRVFFMDEGLIVEDAPPEQLFSSPKHERTQMFLSKVL